MDERDCRLLMELTRSPFEPYESLGRKLGMSGTAAKARLARLASAGIFQGFAVAPSPAALGRHGRLAVYSAPVDASLERLADVPDVAWAALAYPTSCVVMCYLDAEDAPFPDALARVAGRAPDSVTRSGDPRATREHAPLSPLDWRVLRAVVAAPRAPVRALAQACGLSARVVRERRDRLFAQGDLAVFPRIDATREEGAFLYSAYVGAGSAEDLKGLRVPNAQRVATHHEPPAAFLTGFVRTYAEAHVAEERLRAIPWARNVTFRVPQGMAYAAARVAGWIDAEIARWDKARRAPYSAAPSSTRR